MKILLTGATGLVGRALCLKLLREGHEVSILSRRALYDLPAKIHVWDDSYNFDQRILEGIDAVVHLAGEPVGEGRWTAEKKKRIFNSRVQSTHLLADKINKSGVKTFISASAIGIYGNRGDEVLDENAPVEKTDFLSGVCQAWEQASEEVQARRVLFRIGLVLSRQGGLLSQLEPLIRSGFGGPLGSGRQWMSWILLDDLVEMIYQALMNEKYEGVFNAVHPKPVTNKDFTKELAQALQRPAFFPAPKPALKIVTGEFADAIFASQNVTPKKALELGFKFSHANLKETLSNLYSNPRDLFFQADQWIPYSLEEVFSFFSQAQNLEKITPPWLGFKILNQSTEQIQKGTEINYKLRLHGLPLKWKSLIEEWNPKESFVDTQLKGPYKRWHHTHKFEELSGGTLIQDIVRYQLPVGWLGENLASHWVKGDISKIFQFRQKVIEDLFAR